MAARFPSAACHTIILVAGVIVLAAVGAYYNSFSGVFAYDDQGAIVDNETIRELWPIWRVFSPPSDGETVGGRPLLNLSLAINFAISGLNVWSYHVTNLAIHVAAALLLFGIVRRTFLTPRLRDRFGQASTWLAVASALVWLVHPLQTESVTYIVQRAESLAGFFYLLTLYCAIRGAHSAKAVCWYAASVLACLLGMACKEILVTAPLLVFLYDRTFLAGSFADAWRRRRGLYIGLAATWIALGYLVLSTGLIARQAELGAPRPFSYARSQPGVILYYLRLAFWPNPLCMSYSWPVAHTLGEILPGMLVVGLLLAATVWGLMGQRVCGFLGAWFFLILAPTSSIMPLNQLIHEHRMYLPLAALTVLLVAGGYDAWGRFFPKPHKFGAHATLARWAGPVGALAAVLATLGFTTAARNADYQSPLAIWEDGVNKNPNNPMAHMNLGVALSDIGRTDEAIAHYDQALRLWPGFAMARHNRGIALARLGRTAEAIQCWEQALRLKPDDADGHNNLSTALAGVEKFDEAIEHQREALRLKPENASFHNNLAVLLARLGRNSEAIEHYRQALQAKPHYVEAHSNLGNALLAVGNLDQAVQHYREALRLKPDYLEAHFNLSVALAQQGRVGEAIQEYHNVLRQRPDFIPALINLVWLLATNAPSNGGDPTRAIQMAEHARGALRQENAQCLDALAAAYAAAGRFDDAVMTAERAVRLAESAGQAALAKNIESRLNLYRAGRPYREAPRAASPTKP